MRSRGGFAKRIQPGSDRRQTAERLVRVHLRKVGPLGRNIRFGKDVGHSDAFSLEISRTRHSCLSSFLINCASILSMNRRLLKDEKTVGTDAVEAGGSEFSL